MRVLTQQLLTPGSDVIAGTGGQTSKGPSNDLHSTTVSAYDGATGTAKTVKIARPARAIDPRSVSQIFANGLAKAAINAVDPAIRLRALERLAEHADSAPDEVRGALSFKFAKHKHTLEEYEAELAQHLGVEDAKSFMADMRKLATHLIDAGTPRIVLVSATFAGGGVAEMFQTQAHILQQLGIEVEWQKTWTPDDEYGEVCRKAFDAFQGGSTTLSDADHALWSKHNALLARIYQGIAKDPEVGAVFLEDHHAIHFIPALKAIDRDKRIVWRSHVDMAGVLAGKSSAVDCWQKAILPNIKQLAYNDVVFFQPGSVPPEAHKLRCSVFTAPPGIDPLADKNKPLSWSMATEVLGGLGIDLDVNKPHLVTGGRFVSWKGIVPMVRAYLSVASEIPDVDFLVFGTVGKDDPRKVEYQQMYDQVLAECDAALAGRVKCVLNKSEELAAGYKLAAHHQLPFYAPSIREGFNLMCDEAARQGAVPATSLQGGLVRFRDSQRLAPFSTSIAEPASRIEDPATMYTIVDGKIVSSAEAAEIETLLADTLRDTLTARRDDPGYADRYRQAAEEAQMMTLSTSLLVMSRDYLATVAATPSILETAASSNTHSTGAAPLSTIAGALNEYGPKRRAQ